MLYQEAFGADELVALHRDHRYGGVLVAQIGTGQLVILGNGVLVVIKIVRGVLRALAQRLQRLLILVLIAGEIVILSHHISFLRSKRHTLSVGSTPVEDTRKEMLVKFDTWGILKILKRSA